MRALRFSPFLLVLLPALAAAQSASAPSGLATGTTNTPPMKMSAPTAATAPTSKNQMTSPADGAQMLVAKAINQYSDNKSDDAFASLNQAIKLDPNCAEAYMFRGAMYSNKKQWPEAESDFQMAAKLNPAPMYKVQLIELKFQQKQYDAARAGFLTYENDEALGDLAKFKVFLCDLYGGHPDVAKKEFDAFNNAMTGPSYYFANTTWSINNKKYDDARSWYTSARKIYPAAKIAPYSKSLDDLGLLPIPGSPAPK